MVAVGLAYALGSAAVLLVLALGGRALADARPPRRPRPALQRVLGGVMVATALAMALQLDVRFQSAIADHLPAAVVNPTKAWRTRTRSPAAWTALRRPSQFAQRGAAERRSARLRRGARLHRQRALVQHAGDRR